MICCGVLAVGQEAGKRNPTYDNKTHFTVIWERNVYELLRGLPRT
jgi:hypothetical protein